MSMICLPFTLFIWDNMQAVGIEEIKTLWIDIDWKVMKYVFLM
jgi:hypothetical protein